MIIIKLAFAYQMSHLSDQEYMNVQFRLKNANYYTVRISKDKKHFYDYTYEHIQNPILPSQQARMWMREQ